MARTNIKSNAVKPQTAELLTLRVLRREQLSPHFARITLGHGDIERFTPMGFDQWFRLFIPVSDGSLSKLPSKLTMGAYLRYLTISKTERPVLRNYTVRAFRPDGPEGPELDVDFVLHGSPGDASAGPAATWARTCVKGQPVAIIDEGIGFNPPSSTGDVLLVAEESGLPAVAGILASLPSDAKGQAIIEIPAGDDQQEIHAPDGVELAWIVRDGHDVPGQAALAAAQALALPDAPFYGWTVGEQALPTNLRRHWVDAGVPKNHIMFCGYWRAKSGRSK